MVKYIIFVFWLIFSFIAFSHAQSGTNTNERVNARFQNYIRENIYEKVSGPLYDDELVSEDEYLKITAEVKKEMEQMLKEESSNLNSEELKEFKGLINEIYVQLAELYLERMESLSKEDKLKFLSKYYSGFFKELSGLDENLAKLLIKTYQDSFGEPYYMTPSNNVINYFNTQDSASQELFDAAFILHGIGFLIEDVNAYEIKASDFKTKYQQSSYTTAIDNALASVQKLKKGTIVDDFTFIRPDGLEIKLSNLKTKIVYLDLWASWCGPCIQTFKTKTPAFEQKLKDYPEIELMYVSIDEKKDSWEKYLEKNPMKGIHAYSGGGFDAPIIQYFKVFGIPRYVIIGKGNKLLDANAPRPGDEAFEKLMEYLTED